jgi:hypothetical protein
MTEDRALLAESLVPLGRLWRAHVNQPQTEAELAAIRRSVTRGQPYGSDAWIKKITNSSDWNTHFARAADQDTQPPQTRSPK